MKKAIIIIVIVFCVLAAIIGGAFFFLNQPKEAITGQQFETSMRAKNYGVLDVKETQFAQYSYIMSAQIAISSDQGHQIEFYELSNEEYADNFYQNNKRNFESRKTNNTIEAEVNGKNYSTYALKANGQYMYVERIENTVVYVNVSEELENTVKDVLKQLGY